MKRSTQLWMSVCVAFGFAAGSVPADASEVVKLARLVVSGKRTTSDTPRPAANETRSSATSPQSHGNGGSDAAGTAPAPTRGVS